MVAMEVCRLSSCWKSACFSPLSDTWKARSSRRPLPALQRRSPTQVITRCYAAFASSMDARGPLVAAWSESLLCPYNTQCSDAECEYLHVSEEQKNNPCMVPRGPGKLVICAGPERSGSTWLFNALRIILEDVNERVHSYWIHHITDAKLVKRGVGRDSDGAHVLVKTHKWSKDWDPTTAALIVVTERDICGVINSCLRVGWQPKDIGYLKTFIEGYLEDHYHWKEVSHAVIPYEDIADVGGQELVRIRQFLELLQFEGTDRAISMRLKNLRIPNYGYADPITKLWPRHTQSSDQTSGRRPSLTEEECAVLREHAVKYLQNRDGRL